MFRRATVDFEGSLPAITLLPLLVWLSLLPPLFHIDACLVRRVSSLGDLKPRLRFAWIGKSHREEMVLPS